MEEINKEQSYIDDFINWFSNDAIKYSTTDIGQFFPIVDMAKLINKIEVWYEFKYNEDVLSGVRKSNEEVFSIDELLLSLPWYERFYLLKTRYVNMVKSSSKGAIFNINLDEDGNIVSSENGKYIIDELIGMNIRDAILFIKSNGIDIDTRFMDKALDNYDIQLEIKNRLFNSIVYSIILRDSKYGLRRAFMMVKDFGLDAGTLLDYARKSNDLSLVKEIEEYMESLENTDSVLAKL